MRSLTMVALLFFFGVWIVDGFGANNHPDIARSPSPSPSPTAVSPLATRQSVRATPDPRTTAIPIRSTPTFSPQGSPSLSSTQLAGDSLEHGAEMMGNFLDLFSNYALWETKMLFALVDGSPRAGRALVGMILFLRGILTVIGLFVVSKLKAILGQIGK